MLVLVLLLTACGKEEKQEEQVSMETAKQIEHQVKVETEVNIPQSPVGDTTGEDGEQSGQSGSVEGGQTGEADNTGEIGNTGGTEGSGSTGISDAKDGGFEETNDTVYVAASVMNLRSGPSTDTEVVGKAVYGDSFTRLAKGSNGWDKLLYEGQVVYGYAEFLTTKKLTTEKPYNQQELLADAKKNLVW